MAGQGRPGQGVGGGGGRRREYKVTMLRYINGERVQEHRRSHGVIMYCTAKY